MECIQYTVLFIACIKIKRWNWYVFNGKQKKHPKRRVVRLELSRWHYLPPPPKNVDMINFRALRPHVFMCSTHIRLALMLQAPHFHIPRSEANFTVNKDVTANWVNRKIPSSKRNVWNLHLDSQTFIYPQHSQKPNKHTVPVWFVYVLWKMYHNRCSFAFSLIHNFT